MKSKMEILEEKPSFFYTEDTVYHEEGVKEAMDDFAKETAIGFADWILKESILPRDTNWFDAGKHLTTDQLYAIYLKSI